MICSGCASENRQGAKFCGSCGKRLSAVCSNCGNPINDAEFFCTECGAAFNHTSLPSPETVSVSGERKQITVLFADVAGSMDLQEQLDAEVWAQIMGRFVSILAEGVRKYGGTVDKFTGDGIMALFGAPVAQEDHARRACHAAWHLTKAIEGYSDELREGHGVELNLRLGLNSGEVVVGRVGDDVTLDPTALGHTVGLAQRMEAMAEPGHAYLTEYTARLVEGWFRLDELGARTVKGASGPLRVYVLDRPVSSPVRQTVGAAPLVGRERELGVLEDALTMAMDGYAQVVGVAGEAGVGKSRLCEEFADSCRSRGVTVRRAAGVSHGRDVPLLPILAFHRDYFGIGDADDPATARQKVSERLLALDPGLGDALPLLFDFLEVPDPDRPVPRLAPEVRMRRIFDVVRRITARRSERETLVLIFEDLHWFDPQSEAFLERLVDSYPGSRTLVVTNFRPEFSGPWMRHSYYRQLPLAPLREQAVGELIGGLLGVDPSLAPLLGFVLERTGGNPFFVEEVLRALVEDGTLVETAGSYRLTRPLQDVKVPANVQAVLAARIDRLAARDKRVLQTAAVIGRAFTPPVLRLVAELDEHDLDEVLSALRAAEFVQEESASPVVQYRFWHPLTQDVAYQGLMRDQRTRLHSAVARAIISTQPDRLDEQAAAITSHFERAHDHLEAARWNDRAAAWATRHDWEESVRRCRVGLRHLGQLPANDESVRLGVHLRCRLVRFGARTGMSLNEMEFLHAESRTMAQQHNDTAGLAFAMQAHTVARFYRGAVGEAKSSILEANRLANFTGDPNLQVACLASVSMVSVFTGTIKEGLEAAQRVDHLSRGDPDCGRALLGVGAVGLTYISRTLLCALTGQLGEARHWAERSADSARSHCEFEWLAWTLSAAPLLSASNSDLTLAMANAREAIRLAKDSGIPSVEITALKALGLTQVKLERLADARITLRRALDQARAGQVGLFEEASLLTYLAWTDQRLGDGDAAVSDADQAIEVAHRQGARIPECLALLTRAQTQSVTTRPREAVQVDLDTALALAQETGAVAYEPSIHEELGRLHDDEKEFQEALRLYRQVGATSHVRRLEAELAIGGRR